MFLRTSWGWGIGSGRSQSNALQIQNKIVEALSAANVFGLRNCGESLGLRRLDLCLIAFTGRKLESVSIAGLLIELGV